MKNNIYVLTEAGCPLVYAERKIDLFCWYKDKLKKLEGDTEDVLDLECLLSEYNSVENVISEMSMDIEEHFYMILDDYEVNTFKIPSV